MKSGFEMDRRRFLTTALAAGTAFALPRPALALGEQKLGDAEILVLSDGNLQLPLDFVFQKAPQHELKQLLEASGQTGPVLTPDCNITMVRNGDRTIIFDVGAGPNFMPSAGSLPASLEEAGIDPGEVTDVVFTHAHPDHIWGLVDDFDELYFSEANYHINALEWDFWRKDDTLEKVPESRRTFVIGARNRFEYLEDRISLFNYGDEVLPGIEAMDTSGHTPGHTSFGVHSGNESMMIVGDTVTNVAVSFQKPDWPSDADQDAQKGVETRLRLLDRLATDKMGIVGFHMPHPGVGQVEKSGTGYRFMA